MTVLILALLACKTPGPAAVVKADRSEHLLDRPFPSDELLTADGLVDLSAFPEADTPIGTTITSGWARMAGETVHGWSHLASVAFQFEAPLVGLEESYAGLPEDPVRLVDLDSGEQVPVELRFIDDGAGDAFIPDNTLLLAPHPASPLRSGHRYMALVSDDVASSPEGYELPEGAPKDAAVATVFTVQDSLGQLHALKAATDNALDADPGLLEPTALRRVVELRYEQGLTPSGQDATVVTAVFEDGGEEVSYLDDAPGAPDIVRDLGEDWPMEVYQTSIRTLAFQDLADQPYASPGVGLLGDFNRSGDGWLNFDGDGTLLSQPVAEDMRLVISVPKTGSEHAVMTWDHGTGGHAYSSVQRASTGDDGLSVAQSFADAGVVVVSRDQPLYGTRYPLIDEGYSGSLGFYNIGNLPCFRDNQRQAGVDHRVLHRFVLEQLPELFDVDTERVGAFGHSLGSVTAHIGLALSDGEGASAALMSGTGGYFTYYILETGLLDTDNDVVAQIGPLVGADVSDAEAYELMAALVGIDESAWDHMDRFHPVIGLFQLIMDPSDPLVLAPEQSQHETIVLGVDDLQVPNTTTWWLDQALPDSTVIECQPQADYDGHYCTYREAEGLQAFSDFGAGL